MRTSPVRLDPALRMSPRLLGAMAMAMGVLAGCSEPPAEVTDGGTDPTYRAPPSEEASVVNTPDASPGTSNDAPTGAPADTSPAAPTDTSIDRGAWKLVWSDEFEGTSIDTSIWNVSDAPGVHNQELQYYTARKGASANAFLENGALVLEGRAERYGDRSYTSGKIETRGKKGVGYGRIEARMKLPDVVGMWPAFWMLGVSFDSVGWPRCGEVDIMEGKGRVPAWTSGALHRGPDSQHNTISTASYTLPKGNFHDDWHVFAVEHDANGFRWFVGDTVFFAVSKGTQTGVEWPFDQDFFVIVNLAIGGMFDNNLSPPAGMAPQRVYVDYVRFLQR